MSSGWVWEETKQDGYALGLGQIGPRWARLGCPGMQSNKGMTSPTRYHVVASPIKSKRVAPCHMTSTLSTHLEV